MNPAPPNNEQTPRFTSAPNNKSKSKSKPNPLSFGFGGCGGMSDFPEPEETPLPFLDQGNIMNVLRQRNGNILDFQNQNVVNEAERERLESPLFGESFQSPLQYPQPQPQPQPRTALPTPLRALSSDAQASVAAYSEPTASMRARVLPELRATRKRSAFKPSNLEFSHTDKKILRFNQDDNIPTAEPIVLGACVNQPLEEMNLDFFPALPFELQVSRIATEIAVTRNNPGDREMSTVLRNFTEYVDATPTLPVTPVLPSRTREHLRRSLRNVTHAKRVPISLNAHIQDGLPSIRNATPKLKRKKRILPQSLERKLTAAIDMNMNEPGTLSNMPRKVVLFEDLATIAKSCPATPVLINVRSCFKEDDVIDLGDRTKVPGCLFTENLASLEEKVAKNIEIGQVIDATHGLGNIGAEYLLEQSSLLDGLLFETGTQPALGGVDIFALESVQEEHHLELTEESVYFEEAEEEANIVADSLRPIGACYEMDAPVIRQRIVESLPTSGSLKFYNGPSVSETSSLQQYNVQEQEDEEEFTIPVAPIIPAPDVDQAAAFPLSVPAAFLQNSVEFISSTESQNQVDVLVDQESLKIEEDGPTKEERLLDPIEIECEDENEVDQADAFPLSVPAAFLQNSFEFKSSTDSQNQADVLVDQESLKIEEAGPTKEERLLDPIEIECEDENVLSSLPTESLLFPESQLLDERVDEGSQLFDFDNRLENIAAIPKQEDAEVFSEPQSSITQSIRMFPVTQHLDTHATSDLGNDISEIVVNELDEVSDFPELSEMAEEELGNVEVCDFFPASSPAYENLFSTQALQNISIPYEQGFSPTVVAGIDPLEEVLQTDDSSPLVDHPFPTEVLHIPSVAAIQRANAVVGESLSEFDDMISSQDLGRIQLSQFSLSNSKNEAPKFEPGPCFGTARGGAISISKDTELLGSRFVREQGDNFTESMNATIQLRQATKISGRLGPTLRVPLLGDLDSLVGEKLGISNDLTGEGPGYNVADVSLVAEGAPFVKYPGVSKTSAFESPMPVVQVAKEVLPGFTNKGASFTPVVLPDEQQEQKQYPGFSKTSAFASPMPFSDCDTNVDFSGGFKTASNKTLLISSKAHEKGKSILFESLNDIDGADDFSGGFETASRKKLPPPSDAAISKVQSIASNAEYSFKAPLPGITARSAPATPMSFPSAIRRITPRGNLLTPSVTPKASNYSSSISKTGVKNTPFKLSFTKQLVNVIATPNSAQTASRTIRNEKAVIIPPERFSYREFFQIPINSISIRGPWNSITKHAFSEYQFQTDDGLKGVGGALQLLQKTLSSSITLAWVTNHYRWIVWKLASLATVFEGQCSRWNFQEVVTQLMYRYENEDQSKRSAIKLISEQDDVSAKHLVLFVSHLQLSSDGSVDMKLSDGWYEITATLDNPLIYLVTSGKIFIGQKLHIQGASLVGLSDACPPLEMPATVSLKISRNSVRRAKWDAVLGYQKVGRFPVAIHTLSPNGGVVTMLDVVVIRIYPGLYHEKVESYSVYRTEQEEGVEENNRARRYEDAMVEAEKLYEKDPESLDVLSNSREDVANALRAFADEKVPKRRVQLSCEIRVCDFVPPGLSSPNTHLKDAIITMSSRSPDMFEQFKEGCRFQFINLVSSFSQNAGQIHLHFNFNGRTQSSFVQCEIPDSSRKYQEQVNALFGNPRILSSNLSKCKQNDEVDACLVVLGFLKTGAFQRGPQPVYRYLILLTDETLDKFVVEAECLSEKDKLFTPKSILMFLNLECCRLKMEDVTKFKLPSRNGCVSKVPVAPYLKSKRLVELKAWVDAGNLPPDVMEDTQELLDKFSK